MLTVRFRCGHDARIDPDKTPSPICASCGERKIARVLNAPAPRITGCAQGPLVATKALEAMALNLAEAGPLGLKQSDAR